MNLVTLLKQTTVHFVNGCPYKGCGILLQIEKQPSWCPNNFLVLMTQEVIYEYE
jgi:hypothetical protein